MSRVTPVKSQVKAIRFCSTTAAAERLDVTSNTIRGFIRNGVLTGYKIGRLVKLDADEIDAFILKAASQNRTE